MTDSKSYSDTFYLCIKKRQNAAYDKPLTFRVAAKQPRLESGEIAVQVTVELPRVLFQRPMLKASVTVPADSVSPATIEADVAENIGETIRQNLGIDMHITVGEPSQ